MNFNRVAPYFERLEKIVFRDQMQKCRTAFLSNLPALNKIAVIGEGDGRFLLELLKYSDCPEVHYIDSSQTMLDLAHRRLQTHIPGDLPRVKFYRCDLTSENLPASDYDLVATNYFLDVFNEVTLKQCISKIANSCREDAIWLYADFQITGERLRKLRTAAWLKIMYLFFKIAARIQTQVLVDPASCLESHGFKLVHQAEFNRGLMRSEYRQRL